MSTNAPEMPTPETAFELYRELVESNEQAIPILLYGTPDTMAPVGIMDVPAGGIQPVLNQIIPRLKEALGPASWLVLSCESWYRVMDDREEAEHLQPGQLQHEHESGNAEVKECVAITGINANGQAWSYVRQFERVGSQVIWGEPHTHDADGGVPDILLHAVR